MRSIVGHTGGAVLLAGAAFLAACGSPAGSSLDAAAADAAPPPDLAPDFPPMSVQATHPPFVSGTRLKAQYILGEDGTRDDQGLWDSTLNEHCDVRRAEDDKSRCLPFAVAVDRYMDAQCTEPVVALAPRQCPTPHAWEVLPPLDGRNARLRMHERGAQITVAVAYWKGTTGGADAGGCEPVPIEEGQTFWKLGPAIDAGTFVEVVEEQRLEGADRRIAAAYRVFADGARQRQGPFDARLGGECSFAPASDGAQRCFPYGAGVVTFAGYEYADASCTVPVTAAIPPDERAAFAVVGGRDTRLYRTGERYQGPAFTREGSGCVPSRRSQPDGWVRYRYSLADEVPAAELGRMEPWPTGDRLKDWATILVEGALFPHQRLVIGFQDTALSQDCEFHTTSDGSVRCLPQATRPLYFADATCTRPVFPLSVSISDRQFRRGRHLATFGPDSACGPLIVIPYEAGAEAPAAYRRQSGACIANMYSSPGNFFLGPPADLSLFVKGDLKTE
jgi:hypothetical protein